LEDVGVHFARCLAHRFFPFSPFQPFLNFSVCIIFQRNVGLLERMTRKIGTREDGAVLETQYKLQVDVVNQLGQRIEQQLQAQESAMSTMSRTEASRSRATHVKLTRDFRRVEATFKNLQLEVRRKKAVADAARREREEEERGRMEEMGGSGQARRMQMQIEEDRLNEQIMREREQEIRNINQGMHQVNEIYKVRQYTTIVPDISLSLVCINMLVPHLFHKDLAHIVGEQQEQIDQIETQMDDANVNAEKGLEHIEKANVKADQNNCIIS